MQIGSTLRFVRGRTGSFASSPLYSSGERFGGKFEIRKLASVTRTFDRSRFDRAAMQIELRSQRFFTERQAACINGIENYLGDRSPGPWGNIFRDNEICWPGPGRFVRRYLCISPCFAADVSFCLRDK